MTYILIDAFNLMHRAKHVIKGDVETKLGMAYHIILSSITKIWKKFDGKHVVVALEGKSWRKAIYENYKATRKVALELRSPAEIDEDMLFDAGMKEFITFLKEKTNVTILQSPGLEADDLIARWIQNHPNDKHVILSSDTDFQQLISDNVTLYCGVTQRTWTLNGVYEDNNKPVLNKKTGKPIQVDPEWFLFLKIFRGDSSDNVFPAAPRVRETKIRAAYDDRIAKGFDWNNLMNTEWSDHEGRTRKVHNEYLINKELIDLKEQPIEIKALADSVIEEAIKVEPKKMVGAWLLQFCKKHDLQKIADNPNLYATVLAATYDSAK